jgi:hypothetical protein
MQLKSLQQTGISGRQNFRTQTKKNKYLKQKHRRILIKENKELHNEYARTL